MNLLLLNVIATCSVMGALISTLLPNARSSLLSDRLIIAGLGALMGLLLAIAILIGWHLVSMMLGMMGGLA